MAEREEGEEEEGEEEEEEEEEEGYKRLLRVVSWMCSSLRFNLRTSTSNTRFSFSAAAAFARAISVSFLARVSRLVCLSASWEREMKRLRGEKRREGWVEKCLSQIVLAMPVYSRMVLAAETSLWVETYVVSARMSMSRSSGFGTSAFETWW